MQTLKHISLNFDVDDVDVNPLFGIPSEVEDMRTKNVIETVAIRIQIIPTNYRQVEDWGRLDKSTHSSGVVFTEAGLTGYRGVYVL